MNVTTMPQLRYSCVTIQNLEMIPVVNVSFVQPEPKWLKNVKNEHLEKAAEVIE
ncbi:MAG: hypothetical protein H6650_18385 [Ardenticatenales bacterium]|nr:hypothetical protein [Ardenticatenales bacterium]